MSNEHSSFLRLIQLHAAAFDLCPVFSALSSTHFWSILCIHHNVIFRALRILLHTPLVCALPCVVLPVCANSVWCPCSL